MSVRDTSMTETIVACATPTDGALAIVRLSGRRAREIATTLGAQVAESHKLRPVRLRTPDGRPLDDGMAVAMHAPRSYTGEDVVELHLHGARSLVDAVIASCLELGARRAEPGEFTLRAFLHGRMDLAQAEAVGDLLLARSDAQRQVALGQLAGGLSAVVLGVLAPLEAMLAAFRAALDFPEHDSGDGVTPEHRSQVAAALTTVSGLVESARLDLKRGRQVVLAGAPNVGKSSLLNAWVGARRVLVDDTPGTTRDPIEVELTSDLLRWSVWDTAGMREEAQGLERQGIELTRERMAQADLVVWLVSPDAPRWPEGADAWVVGSKADVASAERRQAVEQEAASRGLPFWGWVSVKTGQGVRELREAAARELSAAVPEGTTVVVRARHAELLRKASEALGRLQELLTGGATLDVCTMELEEAVRALGFILGRDVDAEVLEQVFRDFCIGK